MASEESGKPRSRAWIVVLCAVLLVFIIPLVLLYQRVRDVDDVTRDWVVRALSERFESRVELESIHVTAFPEMSVTGEKLAIYYHNRTDVPPMIQIQQFTFHLGFISSFESLAAYSGRAPQIIPYGDQCSTVRAPLRAGAARQLQKNRFQLR